MPDTAVHKVEVLIALRKNRPGPWIASRSIERQTVALEIIAGRLSAIDEKLERIATAIERDANMATHPF